MDSGNNPDADFDGFDTVFGELPSTDLDPFGFERRSSVQSEDSNLFGNFMADDTLGNDFPLDLEADDDANDLLSSGLSPDAVPSLQSNYFGSSSGNSGHPTDSREGRCTTLVSLLTSSQSGSTNTTNTVTAGHQRTGKPMSVLAAEAASKARQEGTKRGPGRPRSEGKLPSSHRNRSHFPGRPVNRIRNRMKSPSLVNPLPPPPSLQLLGSKLKASSTDTGLISPSLSASRSNSLEGVLSGESLSRSCHECKVVIEESKFLSCDSCDRGYHLSCLKPPLTTLPKNPSGIGTGWKCKECRICSDCGSQTPGAGASCRWHLNYSVCDSCYQLRNRGSCCPVCRKAYRVAVNTDMIQCTSCRKMVHPDCDPSKLSALSSPGSRSNRQNQHLISSYVCIVCEPNPPVKEVVSSHTSTAAATSGFSSRNSSTASLDDLTEVASSENVLTRDSISSFNDESLSSIDFAEGIDTANKAENEEATHADGQQIFQHPRPGHVGGKFPGKKRFSSGGRPRGPSGKFPGKKRPKTAADVYRRKRGPKSTGAKFKPLQGASNTSASNSVGQGNESLDKMKDEEPQVETKMVLCSAKDEFVLSQDVCVMCGSLGRGEEGRLIGCSQCGQCYHPYCVNIKVTKVVLTKGWRCLDCTVCEGCGLPHDEGKLLLCDECDISFHTYCLDPPLQEIPQGTWKCNWCVVCVKCSSTSPGPGSLWQKNYTECGPCASETTCSVCSVDYQESDLIIQCLECNRWLHSHCDGMTSEEDCELAADFGYHCLLCRPKDEEAPHITVRKAMQAKMEEMSALDKVSQPSSRRASIEVSNTGGDSRQENTSNSFHLKLNNRGSQVQVMDGVILSESGVSLIKSLFPEPTKKVRNRRRGGQTSVTEVEEAGKEDDISLEEVKAEGEGASDDKKKRARRGVKIGVGGFSVKIRQRTPKEDSENVPGDRTPGDGDGQDLPEVSLSAQAKRRQRRRAKKKQQLLSDTFPVYMQEAFFGMSLAIESKEEVSICKPRLPSASDLLLSEEEDDEDFFKRRVSSDKVIHLPSRLRTGSQTTLDSKKGEDSNDILEDDDDLQYEGVFKDLLPQGEDNLMDMLMTECEGLDKEAGSLTEALQNVKEEDNAKDSADDAIVSELLSPHFDIDMVAEGLPHMDSQDVDDIFSGVLSPNAAASAANTDFNQSLNSINMSSEAQMKQTVHICHEMTPGFHRSQSVPHTNTQVVAHHPFTPPASMTQMPPLESPSFPPSHQMGHPLQTEALPSLSPSMGGRVTMAPPSYTQNHPPQTQDWTQSQVESESEQTQGQKNIIKWEADEALGDMATISPVIYANLAFPNLRQEIPVWTDRVKQIAKLWRQLPTDQRQPYLQKARENRAASRINKAQAESRSSAPTTPVSPTNVVKEARVESLQERQWKQMQATRAAQHQDARLEQFPEAPSSFDSGFSGEGSQALRPSIGMHPPPGVRPVVNQPSQMHPESGQAMKPFDPMKVAAPFDPYSLPPGTPRPPQTRPALNLQRFSPAGSSSPTASLTPGERSFQATPPISTPLRPSSRDSFEGQNNSGQLPSSPYSQPKTPVANSPFHPSSPSVDHFAQNASRPQSHPFSPMTSQGVSSPASSRPHQPNTPGSADFDSSSPFTRPASGPGTSNENFPSPQTASQATPPATPTDSLQHPLKPVVSQSYDSNDPYSRPVMTPRPNTSTEGGFARPIRPPSTQYQYQYPHRMPPPRQANVPADPYAHQPGTPMPSSSHDPYSTPPRTPFPFARQEDESPRQQLRDLLQGQRKDPVRPEGQQWMEGNRPRFPVPSNQGYAMRPPTSDGFRPPLPPSMRMRPSSHMNLPPGQQQIFRHPGEAQRMMSRPPFDPRMRQMPPPPPPQQQQQRHPSQQWTQQPGMRMPSVDFNYGPQRPIPPPGLQAGPGHVVGQMTQQMHPPQLQQRPPFGQHVRHPMHSETGQHHPQSNDSLTDADPGLIDDLDDDELLGLGTDFNILDYADPELDDALGAVGANKSSIFDEQFNPKDQTNPSESNVPGIHGAPLPPQPPPPYPKPEEGSVQPSPPSYNQSLQSQGGHLPQDANKPGGQFNPGQNQSLLSDLDFETLKADILGDESMQNPNQQQMYPQPMQSNSQVAIFDPSMQQQQQQQQQWMEQHQPHPGNIPNDPRFMHHHQGYPLQRFPPGHPMTGPRMPGMMQMRPHIQMQHNPPPPPAGHPALMQAMPSRPPRSSLPRYQLPQSIPEPPFPVDEPVTEQDHQMMNNYRKWLFDQKTLLENEQRRLEAEIARLRKIKKTTNAKARQLKKSNQELSPQETAELNQAVADLNIMMKGMDAVKKALRQHSSSWETFDNKFKTRVMIPPPGVMHSPGSSIGSHPRSVNSPMIASGPGTPGHAHGPGTPQSPAHMSPSPLAPSPSTMMHSPHAGHAGHLSPGHAIHAPNSPMIQSPVCQQRSPMMSEFDQQGPSRGQQMQYQQQGQNHPGYRISHPLAGHFQGMPRHPGQHLNQGQRFPPQQQMHPHQMFDPQQQQQQQQQFRARHPTPGGDFSGEHMTNPSFNSEDGGYIRHPQQHQMQYRPQFANQAPVSQHLPINQPGHSMHPAQQMGHQQGPPVSLPQHQQPQMFTQHPPQEQQQQYQQQHHPMQQQQSSGPNDPSFGQMSPAIQGMEMHSSVEEVGEAKTSLTLNFDEKGLGQESQAGNQALFEENKKNSDQNSEQTFKTTSEVVVTLVKQEVPEQNHCEIETSKDSNTLNDASKTGDNNSSQSLSSEEGVLKNANLTITLIPASEPKSESDEATQSEIAKQNILLTQLLQNCASADTSGATSQSTTSVVSTTAASTDTSSLTHVSETEVNVTTVKTEVNSDPVCVSQTSDEIVTDVEMKELNDSTNLSDLTVGPVSSNQDESLQGETSDPSMEAPLEGVSEEVIESKPVTTSRPPPVERKLSYLDIRRAQLEREPTPPPEEAKPKRKRNPNKRKESKAAKEAAAALVSSEVPSLSVPPTGSPTTATAVITPPGPSAKKRSRKGSQMKHNESDYDAFVAGVMSQLKKLPLMSVIEPKIKANLNCVAPHGVGDLNSLSPVIRGCFGQSFIPVDDDRVSASGQVQPASSARSAPKGFYNQEFSGSSRVINIVDYNCILRDSSSPDPFVPPSPDSVLYEEVPSKFSRLRITRHESEVDEVNNNDVKRSSSPEIPVSSLGQKVEDVDWDRLVSPPSSTDSDPEKDKENILQRGSRVSGCFTPPLMSGPLKDNANVSVTLTLSTADGPDIKRMLGALARILEIEPPTEYTILNHEDFSSESKNEIRSIKTMKSELTSSCRFCDRTIVDGNFIKKSFPSIDRDGEFDREEEESFFCSSPCLQRFSSSEPEDQAMDTLDDSSEVIPSLNQEKMDESCPVEIKDEVMDTSPPEPIPSWADEVLSKLSIPFDPKVGVVDSRKWLGIRYQTWAASLFEPSNPYDEENNEEISQLLELMDITLKQDDLPVDQRKCDLCHEVGDGESDGPARLLNYDVDKWVHLNCALWSPEVYETLNGALMSVDVALTKAVAVTCVKCHKNGASIRCFKPRCLNVYHMNCALSEKCVFLKDKSVFCANHALKTPTITSDSIMTSFVVNRRVYVNRDDYKQLGNLIQDQGVMRVGSLVLLNIGQLLPSQLMNFHSPNAIYPVGYKLARFYWSRKDLGKRKKYICSILDVNGHPEFLIEEQDRGKDKEEPTVVSRGRSARLVWKEVVEPVAEMNKQHDHIKVFVDQVTGEDFFGLTEQSVARILESMPGVDTLQDYNFRYLRSQLLELPLAINPSGCARAEPKLRTHFKRPHTMHTSNPSRSSLQSSFSSVQEVQSPYVKQFVHSKSSQYRKMKTEWRNNVYLARSRIAGLGLFAARDIEKHTMVIEYIGLLIRNELAERNERLYEQQNRGGVYMFRLDDNTVIDATLQGGLARYINHSCNPNCVAEQVQIDRENKIIIFANRRILKGEELAYDYRFDLEDDSHKLPCLCGATGCRKWMN